jgi:hypothetical protein
MLFIPCAVMCDTVCALKHFHAFMRTPIHMEGGMSNGDDNGSICF